MNISKILDVGGSVKTYPGTTHVIDIRNKPKNLDIEYMQMDVCSGKWPYPDKFFDFVNCGDLLEDVKDPIHVCKELIRVAKAGRVNVPSFKAELSHGVDSWPRKDDYVGYCHHRWICYVQENRLYFAPKWATVHTFKWYPDNKYWNEHIKIRWKDTFEYEELLFLSWDNYYNFLKHITGKNPLHDKNE